MLHSELTIIICHSISVRLIREQGFILRQIVIIAALCKSSVIVKASRDAGRQICDVSEQIGKYETTLCCDVDLYNVCEKT